MQSSTSDRRISNHMESKYVQPLHLSGITPDFLYKARPAVMTEGYGHGDVVLREGGRAEKAEMGVRIRTRETSSLYATSQLLNSCI
jgi:hypothetical protein